MRKIPIAKSLRADIVTCVGCDVWQHERFNSPAGKYVQTFARMRGKPENLDTGENAMSQNAIKSWNRHLSQLRTDAALEREQWIVQLANTCKLFRMRGTGVATLDDLIREYLTDDERETLAALADSAEF